MPYRRTAFATGEIYHVFNRGVNKQSIFWDDRDYARSMDSMVYYSFTNPQIRYSYLNRLLVEERAKVWAGLRTKHQMLVDLIAFVLMPNHYHMLVKQRVDHGLSKFLGNWQNSYGKYVNTRHQRVGPLFQGRFKAVRIATNAQLLHVSRYIHINPHTASIVQSASELEQYPWSSLPEYMGTAELTVCQKEIILNQFKTVEQYQAFVFDHADYQRSLKRLQDLLID